MSSPNWDEVADGLLVRRHAELDLSVGLVLGSERALVVDTRGDHVQGEELAESVRRVTSLPWDVALTHGHFDHCFGTSAFLPARVWAHEGCAEHLRRTAEAQRTTWIEHYRSEHRPDVADALARTRVVLPDQAVTASAELDLGGRAVRLLHLGPGHTDHDLVVHVPDAEVVFAGDLVEQGAAPDFEDARPRHWPSTVDELLRLAPAVVVPGHGQPVGTDFVRAQRDELATVASLRTAVHEGSLTERQALDSSPYPAATTSAALTAGWT